MTDSKKDHWNSLANDLGAAPDEEVSAESDSDESSQEEVVNLESESESSEDRSEMIVDAVAVPEAETPISDAEESADTAESAAESKPSITSAWDSLHGELGLEPLPTPKEKPATKDGERIASTSASSGAQGATAEKSEMTNPSEPFPTSKPATTRPVSGFGAGLLGDEPEPESIIIDEGEGNVDPEAITRDYVAPVFPETPTLDLPDLDNDSDSEIEEVVGDDAVEVEPSEESSSESKSRSEREDARPRRRRRRGRGRGGDSDRGDSDRDNAQSDRKDSRRQSADSKIETEPEEDEQSTDEESRPKRRRRRGRRRRKDASEDVSAKKSSGDEASGSENVSSEAGGKDNGKRGEKDDEDRPRRRRRRRRRGRFADNDSDHDETRSVAASHDDVEVLAELDEEEAGVLKEQLSLQDGDDSETVDDSKHRSIPSWLDAVGVVVDTNLESRANRSGGGGGGRGRRRRS